MRQSLSISLPPKLTESVDRLAEESQVSRSEVVRAAIEDFVFKARFEKVRRLLQARARRRGIYTDEDVFTKIS